MKARKTKPRPVTLDQLARRLVQAGFLVLFLYPLLLVIYTKNTFDPAPILTSWLLPWDPLLQVGQLIHRSWAPLVIGAPLLLLALTAVFGRFFCGWICPLGTMLDIVGVLRSILPGRKATTRPAGRNSRLRYYILAAVLGGSLGSLYLLGVLDPLVIFSRVVTGLQVNGYEMDQPAGSMVLVGMSLIMITLLIMELWQPRLWCRSLCPQGALLSIFSRFSLLNRRVNNDCTLCGDCRRICAMNAIRREPHDTDYSDCTFCLECEKACPQSGITFGFGNLAWKKWKRGQVTRLGDGSRRVEGDYHLTRPGFSVNRRQFIGGAAMGVLGAAVSPAAALAGRKKVIRPPGALPEDEFLSKCIICQECVRVCPTGGIRPTFLEGGLAGIGTPQLVPRQGGCALTPSCPNLCASVCPVGALKPVRPEELKIGQAYVDRERCLAWDQGVKCLVCVEACLNHAAVAYQGRVTVNPEKCTGCGRCESGCPVSGSAIRVRPF